MEKIQLKKSNPEFVKLISFAGEILQLCKKINCKPKLYGGLAYMYYTKDMKTEVNDIDFITSLKQIKQIIKQVEHVRGISYEFREKEGYLKLLKNGLKVSFDDVRVRPFFNQQSNKFLVNGILFDAIDIESLISRYKEGVLMSKYPFKRKYDYPKKMRNLEKIKTLVSKQ